MDHDLTKNIGKRTVFVSGSNRGIGKTILEAFVRNGYDAFAHARKCTHKFEQMIDGLCAKYGATITPIYFDMRDEGAMKATITEQIYKPKRTIAVLVNNAGIIHIGAFTMTPLDTIREIFQVNLFAHMRLTQLILKRMKGDNLSICNIASVDGLVPKGGLSAYSTSKAAMIAFNEVLKCELGGKVRVNCIAPGITDTDMAASVREKVPAVNEKINLGGYLVSTEDVANAVYFLASKEALSINGAVLEITGGNKF